MRNKALGKEEEDCDRTIDQRVRAGKAIPIQWRSAPRLDQPLSARSSKFYTYMHLDGRGSDISAKLSVRDQIWYKEKDSWRQALDEARKVESSLQLQERCSGCIVGRSC